MPEWVHVWFWLRFIRGDLTPLPQQGINPEAMTMDSYELYEAEWQQAGSPAVSQEKILAAMGVDAAYDDIPF